MGEPSLKYAVVERERRYLVGSLPEGVVETWDIHDRYVDGTRLRLREVRRPDGLVRKLNHKVRLVGVAEVACTSIYLDDAEWQRLQVLPGRELHKRRHHVYRDGLHVVVDEFDDGTLMAEIDDGGGESIVAPAWLDVLREVTDEEEWTGAGLAGRI